MAKYNLIHNSFFTSTVASGIGNKNLSSVDLTTLTNGNTFIPVVSLVPSDTLCLDVDLTNRIKIDSILLYAEDLTKLVNIDFYYKNTISDSYNLCTKSVLSTAYSATIPYPSAPRYIRCTISGVSLNLTEFFIFNEDSTIGFGDDGSDTYKWLDNTPIGYTSAPYEVLIYNNNTVSDKAATAYVCVDFSNSSADSYLMLADNIDGPYVKLLDGTIYGQSNTDWNYGNLNNLLLDVNTSGLVLNNKGSVTTSYDGYVSNLPLSSCTYAGTPFGLRCGCWSYAEDIGAIFAFFYSGTDNTNGALYLYKYVLSTNVWSLVSTITIPGVSVYATRVSLVYNDNYIYYYLQSDAKVFYRYNLLGAQGNYERLADRTDTVQQYNVNSADNLVLCSSLGSNFIFLFFPYGDNYGHTYFGLFKYTISTNTWVTLGSPTALETGGSNKLYQPIYLCYDPIRNALYLLYGDSSYKVMRYDIAGNFWQSQFFDFFTRINVSNTKVAMAYYNNKLYFLGYTLGTKLYSYDITTNIVTYITIDIAFQNQEFNYLIITAPQHTLDTVSAYFIRNYKLYSYNNTFGTCSINYIPIPSSGTFTSAILEIADPFKAGFILTNSSVIPGKNSISKLGSLLNNTIEIRSSDVAPQSIDEIHWMLNYGYNQTFVTKYIVATEDFNSRWFGCVYQGSQNSVVPYSLGICRRTGRMFLSYDYWNGNNPVIQLIDKQGNSIANTSESPCYHGAHWGSNLNVWVYINSLTLRCYTNNFNTSSSLDINNLYDYCSELDGTGAWYTDTNISALIRLNITCVPQLTITLGRVFGVCSTEDNGCWVVDNDDPIYKYTVKRYSWLGVLQQIVPTERPLYRLTHDHASGFYARADIALGEVYHYDNLGNMTMKITNVATYEWLRGGRRGVLLHSPSISKVAYISLVEKRVIWEKTRASVSGSVVSTSSQVPDIFSWDIVAEKLYASTFGSKLLPAAYDLVWNTLPWIEIPKNGYYLPHCKYHQVKATLQNTDGTTTPTIYDIVVAPVVAISDIQPQKSKPVYIKSNLPADSDGRQFNVRLKVWWSMDN